MTTNRRKLPPNRWGCKPEEDVCVEHDEPLGCRHGCGHAKEHQCKQKLDRAAAAEAVAHEAAVMAHETTATIEALEDGDLLPDQPDGTNDIRHGPTEDTIYDSFGESVRA